MSGGGDLDSTEGHSQLLVGTLPLIDKDPPESPEGKDPPPNPSVEGLASGFSENNTGDLSKDKKLATTPPSGKLKQVVDTPSEYPPKDQPEIPLDSGEGLEIPSAKDSQKVPSDDPFSRFWSGGTADISDKDKKRHRWLNRKPERRHSVELEALDEHDQRLYKYVLKRERGLLPRPRFYSKCPDAKGISPEHAEFILRHIFQQRHQELEQEKLERESERRRQSELPTDITGKPKRLIPVAYSPFDNGEDKVQERRHMFHIGHLNTHFHQTKTQIQIPLKESLGSPLIPRLPIAHQESISSEDSIEQIPS